MTGKVEPGSGVFKFKKLVKMRFYKAGFLWVMGWISLFGLASNFIIFFGYDFYFMMS
jgi:hypothetical protein